MNQPTFTTNSLGVTSTYLRGWQASIFDRTATGQGYELRTYRFDTRGEISFHPTMEDAKAAALAFVAAAPAWEPHHACHWCGQTLIWATHCLECGEQL